MQMNAYTIARRAAALLTIAVIAACGADTTIGSVAGVPSPRDTAESNVIDAELPASVRSDLAQLRSATSRYHSLDVAKKAGYKDSVTECMTMPGQGGMGLHYLDASVLDTIVDLHRPEILVYEPGPHGHTQLVAVEYAVPVAAWKKATPPSLYGRDFHVNTRFQLWVLHAWVWTPNPAGMFADYNPSVSCPD